MGIIKVLTFDIIYWEENKKSEIKEKSNYFLKYISQLPRDYFSVFYFGTSFIEDVMRYEISFDF